MSNSSRELSVSFYSHVAYIGEAMVIIPANLLVAFSILSYSALRRKNEYIVIMALFLADAINMCTYLTAGIFRIWKWFTHPVGQLVTSRYCLSVPHILLWSFSDINAQLMLIVMSDRLLSVAVPLQYIKMSRVYGRRMVLSCYGFSVLMGAVGYYLSYNRAQIPKLHVDCFETSVFTGETGLSRIYGQFYYTYMPQSCAFVSIVIFALVPLVYAYQKNVSAASSGSESDKRQLAKQLKITISMSISCLCTLFIYTIPYRMAYVFISMDNLGMAYACWAFTNNNSLANVIIYESRHLELRLALKNMIARKQMPGALSLWTASRNNRVAPD